MAVGAGVDAEGGGGVVAFAAAVEDGFGFFFGVAGFGGEAVLAVFMEALERGEAWCWGWCSGLLGAEVGCPVLHVGVGGGGVGEVDVEVLEGEVVLGGLDAVVRHDGDALPAGAGAVGDIPAAAEAEGTGGEGVELGLVLGKGVEDGVGIEGPGGGAIAGAEGIDEELGAGF